MTTPKIIAVSKPTLHQSEVASPKRARGKAAVQSSSLATDGNVSRETAAAPPASAAYDIGYKKPPKHTQFKKGQSGNPKGRAKGTTNIWTILQEEAQIVVPFSENGRPSKASKTELAIRSAMNKAVKGDLRALQIILKLFETHAPSSETGGRGTPAQTPAISRQDMDREILDMLGLSEHLSPSDASSNDPPSDDTDKSQN